MIAGFLYRTKTNIFSVERRQQIITKGDSVRLGYYQNMISYVDSQSVKLSVFGSKHRR